MRSGQRDAADVIEGKLRAAEVGKSDELSHIVTFSIRCKDKAPPKARFDGANNGADERTRTADLLFTKQLLYQLSYVGEGAAIRPRRPRFD